MNKFLPIIHSEGNSTSPIAVKTARLRMQKEINSKKKPIELEG